SSSSSSWDAMRDRILIPTLIGGAAGGAFGSISKHRKVIGFPRISAAYASNFAIVTGFYCGARELFRVSRSGEPDDLLNSAVGGLTSGALLGRLQGGPVGAARYAAIFAIVGTGVDYAMPRVKELYGRKDGWLRLPEWSPIRVLDEEAIVAEQRK
ncbi:hypothetical protein M569_05809, partial [Genlisea aurea]